MSAQEEALTVRCPLCKAKPGVQCTYVMPKLRPQFSNSRQYLDQVARAGTPTKMNHGARTHLAWRAAADIAWNARVNARVHNEVSKKVAALRAFDAAESLQLREWLRLYGGVLWNVETRSIRRPAWTYDEDLWT